MDKPSETIVHGMANLMLTGDGWSDYQKAKALDVLFKVIKHAKTGSTDDDILADAANQIESFLGQNAKDAGFSSMKDEKRKNVPVFIDLFRQMCNEQYGGNVRAVYRNRNHVRSAYLWYVSANIMEKHEAKKIREGKSNIETGSKKVSKSREKPGASEVFSSDADDEKAQESGNEL